MAGWYEDNARSIGQFVLAAQPTVDAPLLIGAVVFGIGWGLSGYCPGPALVSIATLSSPVPIFVASVGVGLHLGKRFIPPSPRGKQRKGVTTCSSSGETDHLNGSRTTGAPFVAGRRRFGPDAHAGHRSEPNGTSPWPQMRGAVVRRSRVRRVRP